MAFFGSMMICSQAPCIYWRRPLWTAQFFSFFGCYILFLRALWVWSFFWFIPWNFLLDLQLQGFHLICNIPYVILKVIERMSVDIRSKAILQNAILWPAHSGCIFLAVLPMGFPFKTCRELGLRTSSYRFSNLLGLQALLLSPPFSMSPPCCGCLYFFAKQRLCYGYVL